MKQISFVRRQRNFKRRGTSVPSLLKFLSRLTKISASSMPDYFYVCHLLSKPSQRSFLIYFPLFLDPKYVQTASYFIGLLCSTGE